MPTNYKRTGSCFRTSWTKQQSTEAIQAVNKNKWELMGLLKILGIKNEPPAETNASTPVKCTPGKILDIISPVPVVSGNVDSVRRRRKQLAAILTTETTIGEKKRKAAKATQKEKNTSKIKPVFKKSKVTKKKTKKASKNDSSSDEHLEAPTLDDSSDDMDDADEACTACGETYSHTIKSDDWVNCLRCSKWFHDTCSKFVNFCHDCGIVVCKTK
ncbi:hypothetical protein FQA39_LY00465 [Lamprigera yunnana]|nr:hypothetical protein FQA39_LY00465 [Lamprigera yunnana]